jgi:hypothetical protein
VYQTDARDQTAIRGAAVATQEMTLGNFSGWLRKNPCAFALPRSSTSRMAR